MRFTNQNRFRRTFYRLLTMLPFFSIAQTPVWTNYFGNSVIFEIAVDAQGNKWCATFNGGAAKYDGATWTIYNTNNSGIASNLITSVAIDTQGN